MEASWEGKWSRRNRRSVSPMEANLKGKRSRRSVSVMKANYAGEEEEQEQEERQKLRVLERNGDEIQEHREETTIVL